MKKINLINEKGKNILITHSNIIEHRFSEFAVFEVQSAKVEQKIKNPGRGRLSKLPPSPLPFKFHLKDQAPLDPHFFVEEIYMYTSLCKKQK